MLTLPPKFKQALGNGVRTSLYPLVRIYKSVQIDDPLDSATEVINLSIKETNIGGEAYNPLLLNSPSISSKADIINNKYTISSVSLSISNAPYNGKIFSDDIPSLLNAVVQVYYAANGLDTLEDCLLVYTGTIRRYSQSAETLNLTLEDLTEQKLKTQIPSTLIEDEDNFTEDSIGKPYPMVYGYVDKSPLVLDKSDNLSIDKPNVDIGGIWENVSNVDFNNNFINDSHPLIQQNWLKKKSFLYTYNSGYMPIMENIPYKFGSRSYDFLDDEMYNYEPTSTGNSAQINLNSNNFLYEKYTGSQSQVEGVGKVGIPTRIYRPVKKINFYANNHYTLYTNWQDGSNFPEWHAASNNKFYGFSDTLNHDASKDVNNVIPGSSDSTINNLFTNADNHYWNDWSIGSDNATFNWWKTTELNSLSGTNDEDGFFDNVDENYKQQNKNANFPIEWIQNNNNKSGLHINAQNRNEHYETGSYARLELIEDIPSYPCVTKLLYKIDYFAPTNIGGAGQGRVFAEPSAFWVERNLIKRTYNANDSFNDLGSDINVWEVNHDLEDWHTYCEVPNGEHSFQSNNAELRYTNDGLGGDDYDNINLNFDTTNSTDSVCWGAPSLFGHTNNISSCIANLKEFYTLQDVLVLEYVKEDFFASIIGRTKENQTLSKPHDILQDILSKELGYDKEISLPDEEIEDDWINSFSINEQEEAKSVIENLFKSSIYIPSFDSAGNFKFIDIKQNIEDYNEFEAIDNQDILKYSFGLTKLEDVKNQVNVKYKKDYGSGDFSKETGYGIENNNSIVKDTLDLVTQELDIQDMLYDVSYYGMKNEDAKLEVESDYIRDKDTARKLQRRLLMWYANQHLTMKLDLPASYIHLEAGDYIRFDELIGGKLAFGFDYTQEFVKNGQLIYPVFFVTKVAKSLSKVSLELVQVHRGDFGMNNDDLNNYEIPNPYEDKLYQPIPESDEDYFDAIWNDNRNSLEKGNIYSIINTNLETSINTDIKLIYSSHNFSYGDVNIVEGNNDIDGNNLVFSVISETDSLYGDNVQLNPLLNYDNIQVEGFDDIDLTFRIEISSIEYPEFSKTLDFTHKIKYYELQFGGSGDVNGDGIVNVLDLNQAIIISLGLDNYNTEADLNGDGGVNIQDIVMIIQIILGN